MDPANRKKKNSLISAVQERKIIIKIQLFKTLKYCTLRTAGGEVFFFVAGKKILITRGNNKAKTELGC